jgi:addiction module HigA family antidote
VPNTVIPSEAKRSRGISSSAATAYDEVPPLLRLAEFTPRSSEGLGSGRDDGRKGIMAKRNIKPVHLGRILREEFMEPAGISQYRLAQATGLSQMQVGNIIRGKRGISAETALRLERALGMSAQTWMNLQILYDLEKATLESGTQIKKTTERLNLRQAA